MALPAIFTKVCEKQGWPCEGNKAEVTVEGGRTQKVFLQTFVHDDRHMVRAYTVVGSADALSETRLQAALKLNFGLPHGAMAFHEGQLVMTDTFVIEDADEGEVGASIRFIAKMADRYEKLIYGTDHN